MKKNKVFTTVLFLAIFACTDSPYAKMSDEEIHSRAQSMPLHERYSFYLEVMDSKIPSNPAVAEDLALLGPPARRYIIAQGVKGGRDQLLTALTALSAFDGRCSRAELHQLRGKAHRLTHSEEERRLFDMEIMVACEVAVPLGMRNPWEL